MTQIPRVRTSPGNAFRRVPVVVALGVALLLPGGRPAHATCPPPCAVTSCPAAGSAAWASYLMTVLEGGLEWTFEYTVIRNIGAVIDALTRYANQRTNGMQHLTDAEGIMSDRRNTQYQSGTVAETRADFYRQLAPARGACVSGSYTRDGVNGTYGAGGSYEAIGAAEKDVNRLLGNNETGKSDRGQLQYQNSRFSQRITRYNNPAATGLSTTASYGPDLDIQPYQSVFRFDTLADGQEYETAKDVIYNLAGDVVLDPIRGPALERVDGQNLSMERNSEQARLNLTAAILMGTVERRRPHGAPRSNQAVEHGTSYTSTHSSSYTEMAINALAKTTATQTKGQNLDTAVAMMAESARQLFVLYTMMEQWSALKAVRLAMDVKASSVGNPRLAGRVLQP